LLAIPSWCDFRRPAGARAAKLADFLERLGVSTRFDAYGVSDAEAQRLVTDALDGVRGRNFVGARTAPAMG
jgi:hypothetical protein